MKKYLLLMIIPLVLILTIFENSQERHYTYKNIIYHGQRIVRASEYLLQKKNASTTTYIDGDQHELYEFKQDETTHTEALTDYRYIGRKANNYVYFNCVGDDISSCEIWRIIGVFPTQNDKGDIKYRLKIVRSKSLGQFVYDTGSNDFVNSSLQNYLNNDYYNNLSYISKKMIGVSKFYISGDNVNNNYNGKTFYSIERETKTNKSVDFIGNVGLIYPSDYLYTYSGINETCYSNLGNCAKSNDSWMYKMTKEPFWTITQVVDTTAVYTISEQNDRISYDISNSLDVYPVVYLNYDVVIESGDGSKINPYIVRPMYDSEIQNELEMLQSMDGLDKSEVNVGDTLSTSSIFLIIISSILVLGGILVVIKTYLDKRKMRI